MPAGRPRKPTNLHVLNGNPGKRALPERELKPEGRAKKPQIVASDLQASAAWDRLVGCLPPETFTVADEAALTLYAVTWSRMIEAQNIIAVEGITAATARGVQKHPAHMVWQDCIAAITKLAAHLGLSPTARASMGMAKKQEAEPGSLHALIG
jgi:P27 family predicted phage terminase small subunit